MEYSVKSGYWWLRNFTPYRRIDRPFSSCSVGFAVWDDIWKLQVPPKVKIFMWICIRGAIATRENLFRIRCADNPCCPICLDHSESVEHLLLLCPWVQPVWFGGPFCIRINGASIPPLMVIESDSKQVISCLHDSSMSCTWEIIPIQNRWFGRLSKLAPGLGFQDQQIMQRTSL
ncbi:hypothetical protein TB1_024908 [Malus domestica]